MCNEQRSKISFIQVVVEGMCTKLETTPSKLRRSLRPQLFIGFKESRLFLPVNVCCANIAFALRTYYSFCRCHGSLPVAYDNVDDKSINWWSKKAIDIKLASSDFVLVIPSMLHWQWFVEESLSRRAKTVTALGRISNGMNARSQS